MLTLASASPRRADLLTRAGVTFRVLPADVDETRLEGEAPRAYVRRVARAKALALSTGDAVLAADTTVALGDLVLGKPRDAAEAAATLAALSGRAHAVHTAVALRWQGRVHGLLRTTRVHFRVLSRADIDRYIATGEPFDKAGGYGIQGIGGSLVDRIVGSYTNVVGLPLPETLALLARTLGPTSMLGG